MPNIHTQSQIIASNHKHLPVTTCNQQHCNSIYTHCS